MLYVIKCGEGGGGASTEYFPNSLKKQPTQLVTTSDDDMNPVIQMWDLRNARAPEKVGLLLRAT